MRSGGFRRLLIALCASAAFLAILLLYSRFFTCPVLYLTGINCPSCGMTHAFYALLRLDFAAAFTYNLMIFAVAVYAAALLAVYVAKGVNLLHNKAFIVSFAALMLGFWVVRLITGV